MPYCVCNARGPTLDNLNKMFPRGDLMVLPGEIRKKIKEMTGCEFSSGDEYVQWLGKGRIVNGVKGTNALWEGSSGLYAI